MDESANHFEFVIVEGIIPAMDVRAGRTSPLTEVQISDRLYSSRFDKPGEDHELSEALRESRGYLITPELASEIADLVYYSLQPNCNSEIKISIQNCCTLIIGPDYINGQLVDYSWEHALQFCIIKYSSRLKSGDEENYKELEYKLLEKYLIANNLLEFSTV